jgi:hypothetical protein
MRMVRGGMTRAPHPCSWRTSNASSVYGAARERAICADGERRTRRELAELEAELRELSDAHPPQKHVRRLIEDRERDLWLARLFLMSIVRRREALARLEADRPHGDELRAAP